MKWKRFLCGSTETQSVFPHEKIISIFVCVCLSVYCMWVRRVRALWPPVSQHVPCPDISIMSPRNAKWPCTCYDRSTMCAMCKLRSFAYEIEMKWMRWTGRQFSHDTRILSHTKALSCRSMEHPHIVCCTRTNVHCERCLDFSVQHPMFAFVLEVFRMNEMDDRVRVRDVVDMHIWMTNQFECKINTITRTKTFYKQFEKGTNPFGGLTLWIFSFRHTFPHQNVYLFLESNEFISTHCHTHTHPLLERTFRMKIGSFNSPTATQKKNQSRIMRIFNLWNGKRKK